MLTITVPGLEMWDAKNEVFINESSFQLHLEHSLISLSKWESKFEKAFLDEKETKNQEEMLWYIRFMVIAPEVTFEKLSRLSIENLEEINKYIDSKQTATTFRDDPTTKKKRTEKITAELIYYWMYANGIPTEWERRHLNQLFALIRIFSVKQSKSKTKQSRAEIAAWQRDENARRRAANNTRG